MGAGCPDPFNPDSDGDTLSDGAAVAQGTDPCNADSDNDGIPDGADPLPLDPGVTPDFLEFLARELCAEIQALDLALFNGPNANANAGRRNSLANRARNAANRIGAADSASAIALLESVLLQIDGVDPDWMHDTPTRAALANEVNVLIVLLLLE